MLVGTRSELIGKRYRLLDKLGSGGMGIVYSALDRLSGQQVALKQVTTPSDRLEFHSRAARTPPRLALANEFKTLASLRHPNIISVLDYGFDDERQPYFTMDLLENAQTILDAGRDQPFTTQLDLLMQTVQALAYLHRRGILHRDLKPGNVLVVNGKVKVLDFGLSLARGGAETSMSGTLAYMAPELLYGSPASESSDLYSLGVIAYELFAGRHPFHIETPSRLISDILGTSPDVRSLNIDPRAALVLERLLAKQPASRYGEAREIITAYREAINRPLLYETEATRESFLQAAQFVGRESELDQLLTAFLGATAGQGGAWLVGGESGVGKSRLMDELRTRALVEGAVVLRGQATSEGRASYQLWREPLRRLVLLSELSDLEASALKALIPDIGALLERRIAKAPELDPQAAQTRLLSVITGIVSRVTQPMVIILEDLQWAGDESLALLAALVRIADDLPVLIVGNYRDDERPDLPTRLPMMQHLSLGRLAADSIADLSESMLGAAGRRSEVVDLLRRETEGNVFFLVEVVRALAEEVGGLDRIGEATLPRQVFTGGIQRIIARRLERVPVDARPLLQAAAVIGRQLDLPVLQVLQPDVRLEKWLNACADASVIGVQDGQWRFVHDKLREGLLTALSGDGGDAIYRRVALAVEAVHGSDPEHYAALAYHWSVVGNTEKEQYYAALAGEQALENGAYAEAVGFLNRALALHEVADPVLNARRERQLAQAYIGIGRLPESREHLSRALACLGHSFPQRPVQLLGGLLKQVAIQAAHRIVGVRGAAIEHEAHLLELARSFEQISQLYYWDDRKFKAIYSSLAMVNLVERIPPSRERERGYANLGLAAGVVRLQTLNETYFRLVNQTAEQINHPPTLAAAIRVMLSYTIPNADWETSARLIDQALAISANAGDLRTLGDCLAMQMLFYKLQGDFARSAEACEKLHQMGERVGNIQLQAWALSNEAHAALREGRPEQAIDLLKIGLELLGDTLDRGQDIQYTGRLAAAYWHAGQTTLARQCADHVIHLGSKSPTVLPTLLEGYAGAAEVHVSYWECHPSEAETLAKPAQDACRILIRFGHVFPVGMPRAYLWQGMIDWLNDDPRKAQKRWQTGLALAEQLGTAFDAGLLHYQIGRHLKGDKPNRCTHLQQAHAIFTKGGATFYAGLAQAELEVCATKCGAVVFAK